MVHGSVLTDDFVPVMFVDAAGRCVEEWPDGRRFEVRLDASQPRQSHRVILRELPSNAD